MANKKSLYARMIVGGVLLALMAVGVAFLLEYAHYFRKNVPDELSERYVYIPTGASFAQVVQILYEGGFIGDTSSFIRTARRMRYVRPRMRAGRFEIEPGWRNYELVRHLRGGKQAPVRVVLTNERLLEDVAAKVARFLEPDSAALMAAFTDDALLATFGLNRATLMTLFIPNTYEFFWNTSPEGFLRRMKREHDRFWQKDGRLAKAKQLGLTPAEVYTLASIVEKETLREDEKPRIAGVYLNRLRRGMLLQADPTVVFATRDFDTPRVWERHLKFDSPYNTYLYPGLPPGPIAMASISSIDAVLEAEEHDYLFFCARGDGSGYHEFARTLAGHNRNVAQYRRNLRKRNLR